MKPAVELGQREHDDRGVGERDADDRGDDTHRERPAPFDCDVHGGILPSCQDRRKPIGSRTAATAEIGQLGTGARLFDAGVDETVLGLTHHEAFDVTPSGGKDRAVRRGRAGDRRRR